MKIKGLKETFTLAGTGIGFGILGDALGSEGLSQAGNTTVGFVPVAATIGAGSTMIGMLKDINPKIKKKKV